jgi:shikimate dehydrogenase
MKVYGLIGFPLVHSFSRAFFTEKFKREGIDAEYRNFEIPTIDDFPAVVRDTPDLCGLNVTIPYKQKVIPLLDELSDEARDIGAVNVIRVTRRDGRAHLKGCNADVIGFMRSIAPLLCSHHRRALILGTGGASLAVGYGLRKLGLQTLYVSRHPGEGQIAYTDLTAPVMREHTVIVNCTPVGMFPHTDEQPAIPYDMVGPGYLLYDLIYNPEETRFLHEGRERGATVKNGLEMLHLQALASWDIWNAAENC